MLSSRCSSLRSALGLVKYVELSSRRFGMLDSLVCRPRTDVRHSVFPASGSMGLVELVMSSLRGFGAAWIVAFRGRKVRDLFPGAAASLRCSCWGALPGISARLAARAFLSVSWFFVSLSWSRRFPATTPTGLRLSFCGGGMLAVAFSRANWFRVAASACVFCT